MWWRKWGWGDRESSKTLLKKDHTQHPPKELKVGEQDAYLAQVAAASSSSLGSGVPFCSTLRPGLSRAVCVRGRGGDRWGGARAPARGAGVWGRPRARLPSLVAGQESDFPGLRRGGKRGPVPGWGGLL